jgi:L-lactate dehydrogenase complex protein LldF
MYGEEERKSVDQAAAELPEETRQSVYQSTKITHEKRTRMLQEQFPDADQLRQWAGEVKQHVIENLDTYLPMVETRMLQNGVKVHWAANGASACHTVLEILVAKNANRVVKTKTMVSEEIQLGRFFDMQGIKWVETDLGEFIVQIDKDHPSHIVRPIIHKNRRQIAESFQREGLGPYNDDPKTITMRARKYLREQYMMADAAITGANFIAADSGRIVLVTNEGNSRFCLAATPLHIVLVGIEKIVPRDDDLPLFLNLLARSATAQELTVYTEFIKGARHPDQVDGSQEVHVIFVDNGRTQALESDCREILRCIRCGACLNVCPVYRQASGHAYRSVYPGPVGAVLSPLLQHRRLFFEKADLPKASSLCGACHEVCPVNIPIPDLLLRLRWEAHDRGVAMTGPPMGAWSVLASQPLAWRTALAASQLLNKVPKDLLPIPALQTWEKDRTLPEWRGGEFRKWLAERRRPQ